MICALCFTQGRPDVPAATIINGTAVCLEYFHFGAIRTTTTEVHSAPAFRYLIDEQP